MPDGQTEDDSNEDSSVCGACSPDTDSGPGQGHERVSCHRHHSPEAASLTTSPISPGGANPSSSSDRNKSHHQTCTPKWERSGSEMSFSLTTTFPIHPDSESVATSSSNPEPSSRHRTFSRTQALSTLTNTSSLNATSNSPPVHSSQFIHVPVESDAHNQPSHVTAAEDLNPFSTSLPLHLNSVMFPSLASAIDAVLEDNSFKGIQVEIDALGCAVLPPSEYTLSLESECKFHYSFWDSYNQTHFCVPVDVALHLDPSRAPLYDCYPLALPHISQIAVRLSTVTCQTRFSRLNTMSIIQPNQSYIITYRGAVVTCPNSPRKIAEKDMSEMTVANGIYLSSHWERIIDSDDDSSSNCRSPRSKWPRGKGADQECQGLHKGQKADVGEDAQQQEAKRGFSIRAWIPVPVSLFVNKETRTFCIEARVGIENPMMISHADGDGIRRFGRHGIRWDVGFFDDEPKPPNAVCAGRMLEACAEVTVSHLHSTKEMMV